MEFLGARMVYFFLLNKCRVKLFVFNILNIVSIIEPKFSEWTHHSILDTLFNFLDNKLFSVSLELFCSFFGDSRNIIELSNS